MAPKSTTSLTVETLVMALADGRSQRWIEREYHVARRRVMKLIASPEVQAALAGERQRRGGVAVVAANDHVVAIVDRLADAAMGKWEPTTRQLAIADWFIGGKEGRLASFTLDPTTAPSPTGQPGSIPAGTEIHFQIVQATKVETHAAPEEAV